MAVEFAALSKLRSSPSTFVSQEPPVQANARAVLATLAKNLNQPEPAVLNLIQTLAMDGQVELLSYLWADSFANSVGSEDG